MYPVSKFLAHSFRAINIAAKYGWLPGARYTNLRDVRRFDRLGLLDIDWKDYNFAKHLQAARDTRPILTIARDIEDIALLPEILDQAHALKEYANFVALVPKDIRLIGRIDELLPQNFIIGYSVPSRYGGTKVPPSEIQRPVHLLGGKPIEQRRLAEHMDVVSMDGNRFTLDAAFGDFFDGERFRPHPRGGYQNCLKDSVKNINKLWLNYRTNSALMEACDARPKRKGEKALRIFDRHVQPVNGGH